MSSQPIPDHLRWRVVTRKNPREPEYDRILLRMPGVHNENGEAFRYAEPTVEIKGPVMIRYSGYGNLHLEDERRKHIATVSFSGGPREDELDVDEALGVAFAICEALSSLDPLDQAIIEWSIEQGGYTWTPMRLTHFNNQQGWKISKPLGTPEEGFHGVEDEYYVVGDWKYGPCLSVDARKDLGYESGLIR